MQHRLDNYTIPRIGFNVRKGMHQQRPSSNAGMDDERIKWLCVYLKSPHNNKGDYDTSNLQCVNKIDNFINLIYIIDCPQTSLIPIFKVKVNCPWTGYTLTFTDIEYSVCDLEQKHQQSPLSNTGGG